MDRTKKRLLLAIPVWNGTRAIGGGGVVVHAGKGKFASAMTGGVSKPEDVPALAR
jgi:hypothetical protein